MCFVSLVGCLIKHLTRNIKLKNVTSLRFGVSNLVLKSEKCKVLKLFKELYFVSLAAKLTYRLKFSNVFFLTILK